jgi:hypothetical protein
MVIKKPPSRYELGGLSVVALNSGLCRWRWGTSGDGALPPATDRTSRVRQCTVNTIPWEELCKGGFWPSTGKPLVLDGYVVSFSRRCRVWLRCSGRRFLASSFGGAPSLPGNRFSAPLITARLAETDTLLHCRRPSAYLSAMKPRKRLDWSRRLPRPLVIPKVMTLATLADVRTLIEHLPPEYRERPTWRRVATLLADAAGGGDVAEASMALRIVLSLEGVTCRPR